MQTDTLKPISLGWAMILATLAFLLALNFQGFDSDLNFWLGWINEFRNGGYAASSANYPPILLHWLYLGAKTLNLFNMPDPSFFLIKLWTEIPVLACHLFLIYQVGTALHHRHVKPYSSSIFWLTVFNPAILLDNPIWGQVDLLVALPLSLAFLSYARGGKPVWGLFWLSLALATKFQAIVFFPLIGALALRHFKASLRGLPAAIGVFALSFSPFFAVGHGIEAMARAYWGNVGMYPYATYNAANLWHILVGEGFDRNQVIWSTIKATDYPLKFLTPAGMGLALFGLCSLWVFWRAFKKGEREEWRLALFSFVAFFALSSDMHERYLFSAVPLAALWASKSKEGAVWFKFFTWVVFANIAFILTPKCSVAWNTLSSFVMVGLFALFLGCLDIKWATLGSKFALRFEPPTKHSIYFSTFLVVTALIWAFVSIQNRNKIKFDTEGKAVLSHFIAAKNGENYGTTQIDKSFDNNPLMVGQRIFDNGIGTHAPSNLRYKIPSGHYKLSGLVGIAKESGGGGKAQMQIRINEQTLWQSQIIQGEYEAEPFEVTFDGPADLDLVADSLETKDFDHVNWVDVYLQKINN